MDITISAAEVREVIETSLLDADIDSLIDIAKDFINLTMVPFAASNGISFSDEQGKAVCRWLSAHYISAKDVSVTATKKKVSDVEADWDKDNLFWLKQAISFDPTGVIEDTILNTKTLAKLMAI